ncbi:MAG TPA: hypothetical protein VFI45_12715 [Candidatus Acidoferrum sp.]|nr:hypothetical protein [Candidatus Acidoferrum sp.]
MTNQPFFLGVNYPWANYAEDFGAGPSGHRGISLPENSSKIREEFARIRDCGASVVRWFLFADGRGGFLLEKGIPLRPDEFLFADVRAALELAGNCQLKLCFSLLDYLWLQDKTGNSNKYANDQVLQFAAGREAFLHRVLIPMFREFREHPALFAWEIANEPEWAIREFHRQTTAKMHYADFRAFAEEIAQAVHEFAGVPVTLGSASLAWVRAWSELGLDFYQAHYYPVQDPSGKSSLARQLACAPPLDKPLWLGELPAAEDAASGYSLKRSLTECRDAGLLGAAVWRWTPPEKAGTDAHLGSVDPEVLSAWNSTLSSRNASA